MDCEAEDMANDILRQSGISVSTEVLYLPFSTPINYECWVILDPVPSKNLHHLWNYLRLYSEPDVINMKQVSHYCYGKYMWIGIIIYSNEEAATVSLIKMKYKLSKYSVCCSKASDVLFCMNHIEKNGSESDDVQERTIRLSFRISELYNQRLTNMHGNNSIKKTKQIQTTFERGERDIDDQLQRFTHTYLMEKFGEVERLQEMKFRYDTRTKAVAAVWSISGVHIACYNFCAEHVAPLNSIMEFKEFPFIQALRRRSIIPVKSFDIINLIAELDMHHDPPPALNFKCSRKLLETALSESRHAIPCATRGLECNLYSLGPLLHCANCASVLPNPNYALLPEDIDGQIAAGEWQDIDVCVIGNDVRVLRRVKRVVSESSEFSLLVDDPDFNFNVNHFDCE